VGIGVRLGVFVTAGSVVGVGPLGVAVPVGTSGRIGGVLVDVGISAKMEVWVRLGVGNVKGVGAATPGSSVQPTRKSSAVLSIMVRIPFTMINLRSRVPQGMPKIYSQDRVTSAAVQNLNKWGEWESNPHEVSLRGF
jgi:hypothetical protein